MNTGKAKLPTKSTAVYVRTPKKHGHSSVSDQMRVIRKCAKRRGLEIESMYSDVETID
jgi:hypothetical protein